MGPIYFDKQGLECDFEYSTLKEKLMVAIKALPGTEEYGDYDFLEECYSIDAAHWDGLR